MHCFLLGVLQFDGRFFDSFRFICISVWMKNEKKSVFGKSRQTVWQICDCASLVKVFNYILAKTCWDVSKVKVLSPENNPQCYVYVARSMGFCSHKTAALASTWISLAAAVVPVLLFLYGFSEQLETFVSHFNGCLEATPICTRSTEN